MSQSSYGLLLPGRYKTEQTHQGGTAYTSDVWARLRRVLILGTDHNTFYVGKNELTEQGIATIQEAIDTDAGKTAAIVAEIAKNRRALKQDPAIVALSMLVSQKDQAARIAGYTILPHVIQIPTNLYMFLTFTLKQRGWSSGLKRAVAGWIERISADTLAYWAIKYQQRDGMSFHDVLKMVHPKAPTDQHALIYDWISGRKLHAMNAIPQLLAVQDVTELGEGPTDPYAVSSVAESVRAHRLPREIIPTHFLNEPAVWEALLQDMPVHAMIRNLGKMTNVGLITRKSAASRTVRDRLEDAGRLKGIHPLTLIMAQKQYEAGRGDKGSLKWTPDVDLVDALDEAFYLSLGQLEAPTGTHMYAVDESSSMHTTGTAGNLTCREAAAVMALAAAHAHKGDAHFYAFDTKIRPLVISARQRVTDVLRMLNQGGGTNCSLPLNLAEHVTEPINGVTIFTDGADGLQNQYFQRGTTPFVEAFRHARKSHPTLKVAAVAMAPYSYQLTMPEHPDMLTVVGLDTATPDLLRMFHDGGLSPDAA